MDRRAELRYFFPRAPSSLALPSAATEPTMRRHFLIATAVLGGTLLPAWLPDVAAPAQSPLALVGPGASSEERPMEAVLVSARRDGSSITVTVVSDDKGRYGFPAARMEPGRYTIAIRAVGYKLDGPKSVDLQAGAAADLKLSKTKNLA